MSAEFIEVQKASGPEVSPTPSGVSFYSSYQQLYALARTYLELYKKISWVKAAVDIIADASTAEPAIIRKVDQQQEMDDQEEDPRVKALQTVLDHINPNYDNMELANQNIRAMEINGTAYNRVLRKAGGKQFVGLEYIAFTRVKPNVDDQGEITSWSVKAKRGSWTTTYPLEDIITFRLPHPDDDIIGMSPLESLDLPTAVDIQAQKFNEAAFRNGPYASMVFSMKNADENEVTRNREYIKANFTRPENAHKPMILEGDIEVIGDALVRRAIDGSFIELRKLTREEICAVYRVPVTKITTDGVNRSNTEQHDVTFIRDTIEPLQRLYWAQFNRQVLQRELGITDMYLKSGKKQDVNMDAVNIAWKMVQSGATANEARKIMNLNTKDGYDVPMFLKTVVPEDNADAASTGQTNAHPGVEPKPAQGETPKDPDKVQKAQADDSETQQDEQEFMAAYIILMASMRKRKVDAVSMHDLLKAWRPTFGDVQALANSLAELYQNVWLASYNRRLSEMGQPPITTLPESVAKAFAEQAATTAEGIMGTYQAEMANRMQIFQSDATGMPVEQFRDVSREMDTYLKERAIQKAQEIAVTEAGKAWNDGLFAHDEVFAPETQYTVLPDTSDHAACSDIIQGAPYTKDTIPAPLPLHPHCPHRYYAITS